MSRWVKIDDGSNAIRVNYVVRKAKDPEVYDAMSQLNFRGGNAAVVRALLIRAQKTGLLTQLIQDLNNGIDHYSSEDNVTAEASSSKVNMPKQAETSETDKDQPEPVFQFEKLSPAPLPSVSATAPVPTAVVQQVQTHRSADPPKDDPASIYTGNFSFNRF